MLYRKLNTLKKIFINLYYLKILLSSDELNKNNGNIYQIRDTNLIKKFQIIIKFLVNKQKMLYTNFRISNKKEKMFVKYKLY